MREWDSAFLCRVKGQRSYAYVMRAEEGEPGNEAMNILLPQDHSSAVCGVCQT